MFDFNFLRLPETYTRMKKSLCITELTTWHQANVSVRRMKLKKLTEPIAKWQGKIYHLNQLFVVCSGLLKSQLSGRTERGEPQELLVGRKGKCTNLNQRLFLHLKLLSLSPYLSQVRVLPAEYKVLVREDDLRQETLQ